VLIPNSVGFVLMISTEEALAVLDGIEM